MIVYNVTSSVDRGIEEEWLQWMKNTHIPDVLNTGLFVHAKVFKVLEQEEESISYAVQYMAESIEHVKVYQQRYAPALQADVRLRYGERVLSFRTLLETIT